MQGWIGTESQMHTMMVVLQIKVSWMVAQAVCAITERFKVSCEVTNVPEASDINRDSNLLGGLRPGGHR
jgi:hypothetical protein